jgi:hypothetical protein
MTRGIGREATFHRPTKGAGEEERPLPSGVMIFAGEGARATRKHHEH